MSITTSEKLFERAKKVAPGGVHSPVRAFKGVGGTPVFVQSAKGAHLTDVDGKRYLDFCLSWGPLLLGHQDGEVMEAVQSQLSRGWSYGTAEPYSLELAELITGSLPWVEKIRFVNSGTEAVMAALRVARAATGRSKIVKFDGCYHGHLDQLLVKAGSGLVDLATPDSAGVPKSVASDTIVVPLDDLEAFKKVLEAHGPEIAAVIVEPVPANNGLLVQKDTFLKEITVITQKAGALMIFDEVITGFRMGFGGMAEVEKKRSGITPDLFCYGKIIGGGFPVGAYGGRRDLMDLVAPAGPVYQAGTLSANPIAMAAGLATLKKLKRDNPYARLEARALSLGKELSEISEKEGFEFHSQAAGSMFWGIFGKIKTADHAVRSITQIPEEQKAVYAKLFHGLLEEGVYLAPSGFEVSFLSTAHTEADLEHFKSAFAKVIAKI